MAGYPTFGGGVVPYTRQLPGAFVRVGGRPAGPGGVVPYEKSVPGAGFVRVGLGTPRPAAPPAPGPTPAFPPTGTYNPQRELETSEGLRGLEQLGGQTATSEARLRSDYATGIDALDTAGQRENTDFSKALEMLKESFTRLGSSQEQSANRAGVLQGGALLQSAVKRAENEGKEHDAKQTLHDRAVADLGTKRAAFIRDNAPADAANPLGGRRWQDLESSLANARSNQAFFGAGQQSLAAQEAGERGWGGYPSASSAPAAAAAHSATRYYNKASGRMETVDQMRKYRR